MLKHRPPARRHCVPYVQLHDAGWPWYVILISHASFANAGPASGDQGASERHDTVTDRACVLAVSRFQAAECSFSNESRSKEVIIVMSALYGVTVVFVLLRILSKMITHTFCAEDYMIISAVILSAVPLGCVVSSEQLTPLSLHMPNWDGFSDMLATKWPSWALVATCGTSMTAHYCGSCVYSTLPRSFTSSSWQSPRPRFCACTCASSGPTDPSR